MTVKELREKLYEFDDDLIVMAGCSTNSVFTVADINQGAEPLTNILFLEGTNFRTTEPIADSESEAKWLFWEGWVGNHDKRIEDATCSKCGYRHVIVRKTFGSGETNRDVLNKLSPFCPACGSEMSVDY